MLKTLAPEISCNSVENAATSWMLNVKRCARALRDIGLIGVDKWLAWGNRSVRDGSVESGKESSGTDHFDGRVLLLRLDAIGDFIVWLDAAEGLRQHYAKAEITLVGNVLWTDLAERLPYFDRVIPVRPRRFRRDLRYRCRILSELKRTSYREAIHVAHRRKARFAGAEAILRAVRAKRKVASTGDFPEAWQRRWSDRWYSELLSVPGEAMEIHRNAEFVRQLGMKEFEAGLPTLPDECLPRVAKRPAWYYVLFPGAGAAHRQWPPSRFAEIASRIHQETGLTGLICGGPGEERLGNEICDAVDVPLENWIGRTSICELAAVIADAQFLLSNETSAVHIATAAGTPSVCVLGGGHYGRFVPYDIEDQASGRPVPRPVIHEMPCFGCDWSCCFDVSLDEPVPCVDRIPTHAVWERVREVFDLTPTLEASPRESRK